jgi:PAS domain S-box-containing protein
MPLSLQLNIFSFFLILAALAVAAISIMLIRREAMASRIFGFLLGVVGIWAFGYGMELMHDTLEEMLFWINIEYIGVGLIPALWFLFCVSYSGHDDWLTFGKIAAVSALPVMTVLMVWTNEYHYFHYSSVAVDTTSGPFPLLDFEEGPWYWIHTAYFYVLLLWGTYLLLQNYRSADQLFRSQTLTVLLGAMIPWAVNLMYLLGYKPFSHLDLTPFVFSLTGLVIAYGLLQFRLFDIIPVARDRLIENLPDGVMVIDDDDRVVYCNPAMISLISNEKEGLVGRYYSDALKLFKFDQDLGIIEQQKVLNGKKKHAGEVHNFEITVTPIRESKGLKAGKILYFHNITTLINNQRELETARLKAEESDRLKTSFLANMSHEIRNPMNGIIGFAGFMKDENISTQERVRYAEIIEKNAQHLMNIINDIIDISKIESGHDQVKFENMSVSELMNDLSSFFYEQATKKGLSIHIASSVGRDSDYIITDPQKLRQILVNLINNAIKFTDSGDVSVRARKSGNELIFSVRDSGIGISSKEISSIFERFKQSYESKSKTYGGTGLGLSISKAYAELLGGKIDVQSEPKKGSTFILTVPHYPADRLETFAETEEMKDKNFVEPDWTGKTILIAEDEPVNMMYIKIALKNTKVTLISAETGLEAVNQFEANPNVDLILMDIKMPEMDGFEASHLIRKQNSTVPIIALSGHALVEQKKLDQSGFSDLISKPVKKVDLITGIDRWIRG